jgi:hypothetical protein
MTEIYYELTVYPTDDKEFTLKYAREVPLEDLQDRVGGYVEIWSEEGDEKNDEYDSVYCNEEGRISNLPPNPAFPGGYGPFVRVKKVNRVANDAQKKSYHGRKLSK